jgi:hypothetical protein
LLVRIIGMPKPTFVKVEKYKTKRVLTGIWKLPYCCCTYTERVSGFRLVFNVRWQWWKHYAISLERKCSLTPYTVHARLYFVLNMKF